jgi:hypothetical protein
MNALDTGSLDLSSIYFFFPTFLLPLGIFIKNNDKLNVISPKDPRTSDYYSIMMESQKCELGKSYIPILKMPHEKNERDKVLNAFKDQATYCGGINAFMYFTGELVDNIYQHSRFSLAYIMAQRYPRKNVTEVCIIDDGISIPKSFDPKKYNIPNDTEALKKAIEGLSAKSDVERGFGLRTSLNLLSEGLNASCLIVSGRAGLIEKKIAWHSIAWKN